tara:strand:+ start:7913 stop:8344 length:432 start_codon:yes stop_codon:yes gene_type:complete
MKYKVETKTIDGKAVEVTAFPARMGLKLQVKLVKTIFPLIGLSQDMNIKDSSQVINNLATSLSSLEDEKVEDLVLELLSNTVLDNKTIGEPHNFDVVFSSDYGLLFDVLKFVLEVNYSSFLSKIGISNLSKAEKTLTPKSSLS